jgi:hypothetical protein
MAVGGRVDECQHVSTPTLKGGQAFRLLLW